MGWAGDRERHVQRRPAGRVRSSGLGRENYTTQSWQTPTRGCPCGRACVSSGAFFSFLYLKKIKISKIYVRFAIFQKYPPVAPIGRQAQNIIFFFKFATRSLEKKKGAFRPPPRATGACRPPLGRQGPLSFYKPWPPYAVIPFII